VYANLGYLAIERGDYVQAERMLRRSTELDAKLFPPQYDLGRLLVRLKRYDEAVTVLRGAEALNGKDPGVHYQLFLALSRLKKSEEASRELAAFKQLDGAQKARPGAEGDKEPRPPEEPPLPEPSVTLPGSNASGKPPKS
jgi:Flp pilus assembly protein TadD